MALLRVPDIEQLVIEVDLLLGKENEMAKSGGKGGMSGRGPSKSAGGSNQTSTVKSSSTAARKAVDTGDIAGSERSSSQMAKGSTPRGSGAGSPAC